MILKNFYMFALILILTAVLHLVLISGCRKNNENPVVAEVNEEKIFLANYNEFLKEVPETTKMAFAKSPEKLLKHLISRKLLVQEAVKQGLLNRDTGRDISKPQTAEAVQNLLTSETGEKLKVGEDEIVAFYNQRKQEIGDKPMSEVSESIREFILVRKQQEVLEKLIDRLYQKADIKIFKEKLSQPENTGLAPSGKEDLLKAVSSGKPTIVDFGSNRCTPCIQLKPVLKALNDKFRGKVNIVTIDVNQERDLSRQYRIRVTPTLIFFNAKGKETGRRMGFMTQPAIEKEMKKLEII